MTDHLVIKVQLYACVSQRRSSVHGNQLWFCVDSIELDDDQSDAESTDSTADVFADIPLPSVTTASASVIPLPRTTSTNSLSPTLDTIPLPKSPVHEKPVPDDHAALSLSSAAVGNAAKMDAASRVDESASTVQSGDAVHAKTSIGTITVLLNRKLGPRLSKASIFDVPDDNVKEVNRKLLKLRRLKRMKKSKDGQTETEGGSVTGRKALQQRISEWKEELLNDQNFKSKHYDAKSPFVTSAVGDNKDKQPDIAQNDKTEAKEHIPSLMASGIKTEAVDTKLLPEQKADDSYMIKLYESFMKVASCNDLAQLDWPREMIQETKLAPKLVYSCNPLYFNFRKLQLLAQKNGESKEESKKHKHQKKRKKNRDEKTEDRFVGSAAGHKNVNSTEINKDKSKSRKTLRKDRLDAAQERTKMSKNLLDNELRNKKSKKSEGHTGESTKPNASSHAAQSGKDNLPGTDDKSRKHVSGRHSHSSQPMAADDDLARLTSTLKDTGKSRWDTSSDSELDTAKVSAGDRKTSDNARSKMAASSEHQSLAKTRQKSAVDRSRSHSCHWSSDSSARSRKRSRYRSRSSSASSYSRSSSSYRSSSYSYRRRRRLTYDSSRSSCSYSDTASDYSRSSRSYSRSRSNSRARRWRSRSYSRSPRSRSSSASCSPPRRHSGSQLRSRKIRSDWRSQVTSKRPHVKPTVTPQTKPPAQLSKTTNNKSNTEADTDTKNSSNDSKVSVAQTEPSGGDTGSAEVNESKPVNSEEAAEAVTDPAAEDVKSIPTPEEHMQSIPLPLIPEQPLSSPSFIGPVLPRNHPLAHKQDIPLPATAKFQCIGPNDPLVFRSMPPPPPPPALLTSHSREHTNAVPPPRPPSPPADDMDDILGDEDPIPQMLDVRTLKPATFIPPEQDEQYGALRRQAELHARRQQIREETGMDVVDDDEDDSTEAAMEEQLADQAYLDDAAAMFSTTPVIHMPQHHLVGQPLSTSVAMMASGAGLVPVQMVPAAGGGLVGLEPSMVSLVQQGQTPTVLAVSPAAAALARAQEEAEAEAQLRQQVAAAQAIAAAQRRRTAELVQLLPGQVGVGAAGAPALAALRPAGLSLQAVPLHAIPSQQPQQQLIQLPTGRIIGVPNVIPGGLQVIAQPQPQPAPLVIGPNGTVLRLIR